VLVADGEQERVDLWTEQLLARLPGLTIAIASHGPGGSGVHLADGVVRLDGAQGAIDAVLADQLGRRRERALPIAAPAPLWCLVSEGVDGHHERVKEALFAIADGRTGTSAAPVPTWTAAHPWVIVGGVYDGEGPETTLLTAPIACRLNATIDATNNIRRTLDLRSGLLFERADSDRGPVSSVRFSRLARPGTVVMRVRCPDGARGDESALEAPADHAVFDEGASAKASWMRVGATAGGVTAAAWELVQPAGDQMTVDRIAVYCGDTAGVPEVAEPIARARDAGAIGFDRLLLEQREAWARRWDEADIMVAGDDDLQVALRFSLFQLMASVADEGEAAVGARGLSGPGYRGHVFWDADTFVLPFLAATHPAAARAMLEYRLRRLRAARDIARHLGRQGARFPWESARTGLDVTPPFARDRAGRVVPIRTGLLEDHIVADVAWAAWNYFEWTGDEAFLAGPGAPLLVETARYWASRVRVDGDGQAHIFGVIGPDEYHEPVDDNAYTNVMARWNLRRAADLLDSGAVVTDEGAGEEADAWRSLADALIDGFDADTGVYEQFAGFSDLEPLVIAEVAPRRPIAADLLLGAERVHAAQVIKQADVLMLHHLVPEEVVAGTLEPNLRYYEPRTAHGSSLSPAVHASLLARARDYDSALKWLRVAARLDLDDLTETTAGGLHVATMGGVWQAMVYGFAGARPAHARLEIDPRLPPSWGGLDVRVRFHGSRVRIRVDHDDLEVVAERPIPITVESRPYVVGPEGVVFHRQRASWEVVR
jgi:trehalose/maltose hydrolase-like predicted phosphorylase